MAAVTNSDSDPEPAIPAAVNPVEAVGRSSPLGATIFPGGVNFRVYSRSPLGVELLLFDREDDARPARDPYRSCGQSYLPLLARVRT